MAQRKAVSVLPLPVGAATSTFFPAAIAGHACFCTSVAEGNERSNQVLTAGWKSWRGISGCKDPFVDRFFDERWTDNIEVCCSIQNTVRSPWHANSRTRLPVNHPSTEAAVAGVLIQPT